LVKNGIPYDVAESWPESERIAHVIIFRELDGEKFDFEAGRFIRLD